MSRSSEQGGVMKFLDWLLHGHLIVEKSDVVNLYEAARRDEERAIVNSEVINKEGLTYHEREREIYDNLLSKADGVLSAIRYLFPDFTPKTESNDRDRKQND